MLRLAAMLLLVVVALAPGCDSGGDKPLAQREHDMKQGETIGRIDRLPGGTPVVVEVRTLLTAECRDGQLRLVTDVEEVTGPMDCRAMPPATVMERFLAKPVAITFAGRALVVQTETSGSVEFPVEKARAAPTDATP